MIGAWLVTSVNEWAVGQERVLVLTSVAIHRLRFDRERMAVVALTRMPLRCCARAGRRQPAVVQFAPPGRGLGAGYTDREDGRRSVGEWGQRLQTAVGALAACGDVGEKPPARRTPSACTRRWRRRCGTAAQPPPDRRARAAARVRAHACGGGEQPAAAQKRAASPTKAAEPAGRARRRMLDLPRAAGDAAVRRADGNGLRACNAHFYHEACAAQLAKLAHAAVPLCRANYDAIRRVPQLSEEEAEEPRLATLIMSMHV